jgi:uncharacterized membrane protein YfcA
LPDPRHFRLFVAAVLAYLALRMLQSLRSAPAAVRAREQRALPPGTRLRVVTRSWRRVIMSLGDARYSYAPLLIAGSGVLVGSVAGAYGVGGGALMAPFLISVLRLPVHGIAGANLVATLFGSVLGIGFYTTLGPLLAGPETAVQPDWLLGLMFGIGALVGTYLGARWQRQLPERWIKLGLALLILFLAGRYLWSSLA